MTYVARYIDDAGAPPGITEPLLRWLAAAGADEFTVSVRSLVGEPGPTADAFEDALAPFELPPARRRVLGDDAHEMRVVRRWMLSEASIDALLPFVARGLFHAAPDPAGWLEDFAVHRDGELVLGVVSHEREGVIRLRADEHAAVAALGVRSSDAGESLAY